MKNEKKLLKCDTLWVVPIWNRHTLFCSFHHIPSSNYSLLAESTEDCTDLLHLPTACTETFSWNQETHFELGPKCSAVCNESTQ